jgi:hypothetical protein
MLRCDHINQFWNSNTGLDGECFAGKFIINQRETGARIITIDIGVVALVHPQYAVFMQQLSAVEKRYNAHSLVFDQRFETMQFE